MKTSRKIATVAVAVAVLGLGSAVHAQEADSARAGGGDRPMPMIEGGDMQEEMGMPGMMRMMRMMRGCMDMMDSMGMEMGDMSMERMRKAHEAMRQAAGGARDRTREVLAPEQRDRLSELARAGREGCPMHEGGSGAIRNSKGEVRR